jgi:geranylgeranyl diphosphate synthase, type II
MHSIDELKEIVEEGVFALTFNAEPKDLYDPITYMLSLDAKRMRPVLVLCGCDLFGGDISKAITPALGMEVFHNFTLLHDDIMDNAPLRRSMQTVHTRWNPNVAILSGDTMFVKACQLMMQTDVSVMKEVMELFLQTAAEVCEGQQFDMDFEKRMDVSLEEYIRMITFKTAVLPAACLKTGAVIAGASRSDAEKIYEFGKNIGIAFQLKDDILDVFGDNNKFGKQRGGDILANKKTFLLIKALELTEDHDAQKLRDLYSEVSSDPDTKIAEVTSIFTKHHVKELAGEEMERYFRKALVNLEEIRVDAERKKVLQSFAGTLMLREV